MQTSYRSRITISGDTEIINRLKSEVDKLILAGEIAVNNGLIELEKGTKRDCPVNTDPEDVDTIHLKDSIYIEPAKYIRKQSWRVPLVKAPHPCGVELQNGYAPFFSADLSQ